MSRAWILLGAISLLIGLVTCLPLFGDSQYSTGALITRQVGPPPSCAFDGNPDFYGLGIRIGIYLQWITAYLANHFLREAVDSNLETNTIFLLALFVATAVTTANDTVQTAELVVLLHLCFGFLFSILSIWGHRTGGADLSGKKKIRFPLIGSFFRLTLATAVSAYALWFWFTGRDLHHRATSQCADYTFLFAKVDVAGGVRYFFELQSSIILAGYSLLFMRELLMIITFFCLVCGQTMIISAFAVWFGSSQTLAMRKRERERLVMAKQLSGDAEQEEKRRSFTKRFLSDFLFLLKEWYRLSFAMGWKQANGKESAGENRPWLMFYLVPALDASIFVLRTTIQFLCLVLFKWCPKIDFLPLMKHPLMKLAFNPENQWRKLKFKLQQIYESKQTTQMIYTINLICIVWTILSVELTLFWNEINGVYTLQSTGQLIPFVIGLVGLLRLFHGISVERSKLDSTEVLMALLDNDAESETTPDPSILKPRETSFPINETEEAVFWNRKPYRDQDLKDLEGAFYKRRHSINIINKDYIQWDREDLDDFTDWPWDQYHLQILDNYWSLLEWYPRDNIEIVKTNNMKREVYFVKDFRKQDDSIPPRSLRRRSRSSSLSRSRSRSRRKSKGRWWNKWRRGSKTRSISSESRSSSRSSTSRPRLAPQEALAQALYERKEYHQRNRIARLTRYSTESSEPRGRRRSTSLPRTNADIQPALLRESSQPPPRRSSQLSEHPDNRDAAASLLRLGLVGAVTSDPAIAPHRQSSQSPADEHIYNDRNRRQRLKEERRERSERRQQSPKKPLGTTLSKIWKRSKPLAILFFFAIIFILLPTWLLFKIFKKPIVFVWRHSRHRLKYAVKELTKQSKIHYKKVGKEWSDSQKSKSQSKEPTTGERDTMSKPVQEAKKRITQPHKRPLLAPKHTRLRNALSSRSFPLLIQTISELLNEIYPKMPVEMPQTHTLISNIPVFFDEAKEVRKKKVKGEIGRTLQHEILAEKWKKCFGEGIGAKILEEMPKGGEKESSTKAEVEEMAGEAETKTEEAEVQNNRASSVAEDDALADSLLEAGEVLERWFSWGGTSMRTWEEDPLPEGTVVTAVVHGTSLTGPASPVDGEI